MEDIEENEDIAVHPHEKKGRHRKKQLYQTILQQMEFYFSDSNLTKDRFLAKLTSENSYVDISVFLKFNKIRALTDNINDIAKALKKSTFLQLSEDATKVCRTTPVQTRENIDDCTIYVERIPIDITHDGLTKIFSRFGNVQYVSIPKYKHNKMIKGFAFIEFDTIESAQKALDHFASIGCRLPSQMPPDKLYSIATYDASNESSAQNTDSSNSEIKNYSETPKIDNKEDKEKPKETENEQPVILSHDVEVDKIEIKKRHLDTTEGEEEDVATKKAKIEESIDSHEKEAVEVNEESAEQDTELGTEKKRRRRKRKDNNDVDIKEMGLQILSKREWKRLRNKYLDLQRAKMNTLKAQLYRARFSNANALNQNNGGVPNDQEKKTGNKFIIEPGTVIHMQLLEPCIDLKNFKAELKTYSTEIKFIDINEGSFEAYVRFNTPEAASKFVDCPFPATMSVLEGEVHKKYFEKAQNDRLDKFKKSAEKPKIRGREKLLKKAEKALGKHIRFDEAE